MVLVGGRHPRSVARKVPFSESHVRAEMLDLDWVSRWSASWSYLSCCCVTGAAIAGAPHTP